MHLDVCKCYVIRQPLNAEEVNVLIWYDPSDKVYQSGTIEDLEKEMIHSKGEKSLQVLYEFTETPNHLIDKMLYSLNSL